jgi:hypothetical protein
MALQTVYLGLISNPGTVGLWAGYLTSLCFHFLICLKWALKTIPTFIKLLC